MFQNAVATIMPSMSARSATGWSVMANLQEIAARLKVKTDYHVAKRPIRAVARTTASSLPSSVDASACDTAMAGPSGASAGSQTPRCLEPILKLPTALDPI
jgi:hypothetical protein